MDSSGWLFWVAWFCSRPNRDGCNRLGNCPGRVGCPASRALCAKLPAGPSWDVAKHTGPMGLQLATLTGCPLKMKGPKWKRRSLLGNTPGPVAARFWRLLCDQQVHPLF